MGFGRGFGKAILFNEHFVVYGISGIASAIGLTTTAEAAGHDAEGGLIIDCPCGSLSMHTFRKLPTNKPNRVKTHISKDNFLYYLY